MTPRRWALALDLALLLVVLPLLALPVALVAGEGLASFSRNDCADPCEAPATVGMLVWAAILVTAWAAYWPVLRRLHRRTAGRALVDRLSRHARHH